MPNWCENDLVVKGKPKDLNEFIEFVKNPDMTFDFNKIAPMPEVFKAVVRGFTTIDGEKFTHWREHFVDDSRVLVGVKQEELDRWKAEYGHADWYSWSIANWGTKWNANEPILTARCAESIAYTFSTAWSPPLPIIEALAERFPKLKLSLKYYECGCAFKGYVKYAKGVVIEKGSSTYAGNRGG